ncbi:Transcriptional regulator, AraC family protein [Minicystis rosea]|nr:Transcriptional regulator, AraC family protein [Minicystis rosea]
MPRSPKGLSQRPAPTTLEIEDPRGDVLADVLSAARLRNVLYRRLECRAPWGVRAPFHDRAVFYLVARGTARLDVDGMAGMTLSAGDVVFIPRGAAHTLRDSVKTKPDFVCQGERRHEPGARKLGGDGETSSILAGFFELGAGRHTALLEQLPPVITLSATDVAAGPWVAATVQLIVAESASPGPASTLVLQRLADVLFVQALRSVASHSGCGQRGLTALMDDHVSKALRLMHARVEEPWTVASLAAAVGLSRSGLAARFTELVGEPPLQYLARWRMARAAEMLCDTSDGIGEIAARVGYESVPSFNKAYKRWQGESPGASRRRQRAPDLDEKTPGRTERDADMAPSPSP